MAKRNGPRTLLNDRIDWNLLRTFLAIVEEGSISRAAVRLYVTQSAVSQSLKRLEQDLQQRLIERHGRQFEVTPAGEQVRGVAELMYGNVSRLANDFVKGNDAIAGSVRLLTASRVHSFVYDSFLTDFHAHFSRVEVHIEVLKSADIVIALLANTASAGLALCPPSMRKLEKKLFLRQRYAMYCGRGHRLFGRPDTQVSDLVAENFVSFTSDAIGSGLSPLAIFRDQHGLSGRIVASSSNHDEVKRLIFAGFGIGFLPEHSVIDDTAANRLWRLPPGEGVADVDLFLLWNGSKLHSTAGRFALEWSRRIAVRTKPDQRSSHPPRVTGHLCSR